MAKAIIALALFLVQAVRAASAFRPMPLGLSHSARARSRPLYSEATPEANEAPAPPATADLDSEDLDLITPEKPADPVAAELAAVVTAPTSDRRPGRSGRDMTDPNPERAGDGTRLLMGTSLITEQRLVRWLDCREAKSPEPPFVLGSGLKQVKSHTILTCPASQLADRMVGLLGANKDIAIIVFGDNEEAAIQCKAVLNVEGYERTVSGGTYEECEAMRKELIAGSIQLRSYEPDQGGGTGFKLPWQK